jgi:hypothetical protein
MFAPSVPFGKAASSSCVNLATIASIFAAEMWPLLVRCLRCFAASSDVSGAATTRVASAAAMCLSNVLLIFMSERGLLRRSETTSVFVA